MPYTTQRRDIQGPLIPYSWYYYGGSPYNVSRSIELPGKQETYSYRSVNNRETAEGDGYESKSGEQLAQNVGREYRTRYDNGHPFWTKKTEYDVTVSTARIVRQYPGGPPNTVYNGPIWPVPQYYDPDFSVYSPAANDINVAGSQMFNRAIPTRPDYPLATSLLEVVQERRLPDRPGASIEKSGLTPSSYGNEYLNFMFGIRPAIADLHGLAHSIQNFHRNVRQFRKDSDKTIRRRVDGPKSSRTEVVNVGSSRSIYTPQDGYGNQLEYTGLLSSSGVTSVVDQIDTKMWFSGAFIYHLAQDHDFLSKMEMYDQLAERALGIRSDVDDAWNSTPWSWLLNWFVDSKTFVSNVSALGNDSLVCKYGYVMIKLDVTRTYLTKDIVWKDFVSGPKSCSLVAKHCYKQRIKATPYGFGSKGVDLSPTQWSILGALGLTKGPTQLRTF